MKTWDKLKLIFKKIGHGKVKVTIENGEPVSVSSQAVVSGKGEKTKIKLIRRTIDLTK